MRLFICSFVFFVSQSLIAQDKPTSAIKLHFATQAEAANMLAADDEFVQRLSPFDRSARLKTEEVVDKATYLKFVSQQTLDWTDEEKANLDAAWLRVMSAMAATKFKTPAQVSLIKTTGLEEGDAAYTRGTSIILPKSKAAGRSIDSLLAHELFHVLSRHDAVMRERLYGIIGFRKCGELQLPSDLQARRITNPDAPINDHCIQIKLDGKPTWVVPILTSKSEKYDKQRGGAFFDYLDFKLMVIESADARDISQPLMVEGKPVLVDARKAEGFIEQIGKNTGYIIHPDEILADNFAMIITKRPNVPQPELLEKIGNTLK